MSVYALDRLAAAQALPRTVVVSVRNVDPLVWRADPVNLYVGRGITLRTKALFGRTWPNSGWGNPARLPEHPTDHDRRQCLRRFIRWFSGRDVPPGKCDPARLLRQQLPRLFGRRLGCWCGEWDGRSERFPLCHACVYADLANAIHDGGCHLQRWLEW